MKGGAHPSTFAALSFPESKKGTAGLTYFSRRRDGETESRSHELPVTLWSITEHF